MEGGLGGGGGRGTERESVALMLTVMMLCIR